MAEPGTTGTVLVVDDHELVRNLLIDVLDAAGFDVLGAGSGPEAIDLLMARDGDVACIVQDMSMPGMSGPETIEKINENWPASRIVVLSVDDEASVRAELRDLPFNAYLEKPCDTDELVRTVRDVIESA